MVHFRDLDKENIQTVPNELLVDLLFESMMEMKKIEFIKEEKHELSMDMGQPDFDLLKSNLDYKDEDDERWRIKVPFVNERERKYYQGEISFGLEKYTMDPETGGFVKCDSRIIEKPLGLVEIHHFGRLESRLYKNHTFPSISNTYDHFLYFYYDYDQNKYVQVHSENLKKAKYLIESGQGFEAKSEDDEKILLYLEKENIVKLGISRLKRIMEEEKYHRKFYDFLNDHYDKEKGIKEDGKEKNGTRLSIENIAGYVERYKWYMDVDFTNWMKIKFLLTLINREEYEKLMEEKRKTLKTREEILQEIATLFNYLEGTTNERATFDLSTIQIIQGEEIRERIKKLLNVFVVFKTPKPSKVPDQALLLKQGFIYDSKNHKLYPNAAEVERRRLRPKEFNSDDEYEAYQNEVLKRLRDQESS